MRKETLVLLPLVVWLGACARGPLRPVCVVRGVPAGCAEDKGRLAALRATWLDWRGHQSFVSTARGELHPPQPDEIAANAIGADMHHLMLAFDTLYLRNLPGVATGMHVVIGIEIEGLRKDGKSVRTVVGPLRAEGPDARIHASGLAVTLPAVYTGKNLAVTLRVQPIHDDEVDTTRGMIEGFGSLLRKVDPRADAAVSQRSGLYARLVGALRHLERWSYSFTLHPAESVYRDRPDVLLLAGARAFVFTPPANAPASLRQKVSLKALTSKVVRRGNRLVWKDSGAELEEAPYLLMRIGRYHRWPSEQSELRRAVAQIDALYDSGSFDVALAMLRTLPALIVGEPTLTQPEKNLERAMMELREAKIAAALALKKRDRAAHAKELQVQLDRLAAIQREFAPILEPHEKRELDFRARKLRLELNEAKAR